MTRLTRRRFLTIAAACMALPARASGPEIAHWRGRALGASASMKLVGVSPAQGEAIFAEVEQELARLEAIFSLYQPTSEISRLNRDGSLPAPSADLLNVLSLCTALHDASGGAFDPTIQPLWFALANGAQSPEIDVARSTIGWDQLRFDTSRVWFTGPSRGQAITLNGIAQGAITDRIAALLKARGLRNVLIDMGEIVAMGSRTDAIGWAAGIADPDGIVQHRLTLKDQALATSSPHGTRIGPQRDQPHIIAPKGTRETRSIVSVSAPYAALADGLSTALCLVGSEVREAALARFPQARIEFETLTATDS